MRTVTRLAATALLATAVAAPSLQAQDSQRGVRDRNRISTEEIEATSATNAYELVNRLRPQWLRTRGTSTLQPGMGMDSEGPVTTVRAAEIQIYVNGMRFGSHRELRSLATSDIASLEYLDSRSATQRFGTGNEHGAIVVNLRR